MIRQVALAGTLSCVGLGLLVGVQSVATAGEAVDYGRRVNPTVAVRCVLRRGAQAGDWLGQETRRSALPFKHERRLIPSGHSTEMVPCRPASGRRCGTKFAGDDRSRWRQRVWELPTARRIVSKYHRDRVTCP
jgi:hypothetical protein